MYFLIKENDRQYHMLSYDFLNLSLHIKNNFVVFNIIACISI